jgi:hypothetical protein
MENPLTLNDLTSNIDEDKTSYVVGNGDIITQSSDDLQRDSQDSQQLFQENFLSKLKSRNYQFKGDIIEEDSMEVMGTIDTQRLK